MTNIEKYRLAWNYYCKSRKVNGNDVQFTLTEYMKRVSIQQVEEMIVLYNLRRKAR